MKQLILTRLIPVLCLIFSSCKEIMVWRYGIHQPRDESVGSVRKFLAGHEIPSGDVFVFRDSAAFLDYLEDPVCRKNLFRAMIYSHGGYTGSFLPGNDSQSSEASRELFLDACTLNPADTSHTVKSLLTGIVSLDGRQVPDTAGADFVAVVTWATFLGSYNRRLFGIREELTEYEEIRVIPVFLSMDMMECWHLRKKQRLEFRDD